ncbi:hypothetical protein GMMP13_1650014 [Candidatus Magnetomoraceae bacterium gMMP-13]
MFAVLITYPLKQGLKPELEASEDEDQYKGSNYLSTKTRIET